jgi:hypothetical protein
VRPAAPADLWSPAGHNVTAVVCSADHDQAPHPRRWQQPAADHRGRTRPRRQQSHTPSSSGSSACGPQRSRSTPDLPRCAAGRQGPLQPRPPRAAPRGETVPAGCRSPPRSAAAATARGPMTVVLHEAMRTQSVWAMATDFSADWFHPDNRSHRVGADAFGSALSSVQTFAASGGPITS